MDYELTVSEPLKPKQIDSSSRFSSWSSFKHHMPRLLISITVDIIIPVILYFIVRGHMVPVYSLLIASSPSLFMVIFKGIWERSFDAIGFIVSAAFILSAILALLFKNPTILLLEKSWLTGAGAILFAITLIPFKCGRFQCRPMVYYFYHDLFPVTRAEFGLPDGMFETDQYAELQDDNRNRRSAVLNMREVAQVYSWLYDHCSSFRATCYFMTGAWVVAFAIECTTRYIMIISGMSMDAIFLYGQVIFLVIVMACAILQICAMIIERRHTLEYIAQWKLEQNLK